MPPSLQDWLVLGGVDLDEYVDANLSEVPDWELNFKMLKGAAKDAERLPNEAKVGGGGCPSPKPRALPPCNLLCPPTTTRHAMSASPLLLPQRSPLPLHLFSSSLTPAG